MAAAPAAATLLVVHHSPGVSMPTMVHAACDGAAREGLEGIVVRCVPALALTSADVLSADAYLLATPANLGYMSGALKHAFDTTYNDALGATRGRPFGVLVHGESDTAGAILAIHKITTGLQWREVVAPVSVIGGVGDTETDACAEAAAVVAASALGF